MDGIFVLWSSGLVAVMQILMIWAGQVLNRQLPSGRLSKAKFLPGAVLVVIGS
jgi:hypothetical protein